VDKSELDAIESALGIRLPPAYRAAAEAGHLDRLLNADLASVVAINRALRDGDFGDSDWPHGMFAFADDGGGNHFCLDLSAPRLRVLSRDHETLEVGTEAEDLETWLKGR
jgi:hypothetical protein